MNGVLAVDAGYRQGLVIEADLPTREEMSWTVPALLACAAAYGLLLLSVWLRYRKGGL